MPRRSWKSWLLPAAASAVGGHSTAAGPAHSGMNLARPIGSWAPPLSP
eukprot:CAMPEP_0205999762 /NCGR_PEP_ID=MMETSP1464-20131121/1056_1 /ASSEMBLY_ACC=CAM_ASM_001124 /TAXON_ID=119497 /ORGANISM="Exanthemachrysis gayraliae, Strain RCC1523" /LENGTH=47 /DNA_ID= /DNA_START= /DNA_END= /DNA_ORIENTATION=